MSTAALPVLTNAVTADTSATASTVAMRDASGGLYGALVQATTSLQTLGSLIGVVSTQTASFTAGPATDYLIDTTAGAVTVTLPPAASNAGVKYSFTKKNSSANNIALTGVLGVSAISTQYARAVVYSDGTNWYGA